VEELNGKPAVANGQEKKKPAAAHPPVRETAFDRPRDFLNNRFVYAVISARAHGLSLGVDLNPDQRCDFDCVYCEVDRRTPPRELALDVDALGDELRRTLMFVHQGRLRELPFYQALPDELLPAGITGVGQTSKKRQRANLQLCTGV
jgi:hypothetical protein